MLSEIKVKIIIMENLFVNAPNPSRLLIIVHDDFFQAISPLAEHKNRTGMPAHTIKLSQIVKDIADVSQHPWAIKQVIAQGHKNQGVYYVMLVGDTFRIPLRHRFVRQPNGGSDSGLDGTYNPTDNYYANLYWPGGQTVSNWDGNNDGKFNESIWADSPKTYNPDKVDGYPHVAVGRIPAHTVIDVKNYVQKVIEYEEGMRMRSIHSFSFLSDQELEGSREGCENVVNFSQISAIPNVEIQKFHGNALPNIALPNKWLPFVGVKSEIQAFTAKWMIHMGHGETTKWAIKVGDNGQIDNSYVNSESENRWNTHDSFSLPIILSAGCDTGQLMPNAPFHEYRGLNPDTIRWIWYYTDSKTAEDKKTNQQLAYPVIVPTPNPYDYDYTGRTFAHSWLCNSRTGGAIAYLGATVVHQGAAYGADLFLRMVRRVKDMNILGDIWAQASRDYLQERLSEDDILGSARIYLGIQTLYGDPSLRLSPVISYGISAVVVNGRLTVFARTMHGTLTHKFYDNALQKWSEWIHLKEGQISSSPSAVMAGDRLTVFARTAHGILTHKFYDNVQQKWTGWIHFEGDFIASSPSAIMGGNRLTVFANDEKGRLTHRYYDTQQQGWTPWISLGTGQISSAPAVVMAGDRLTVFAKDEKGQLTHRYYDTQQQGWTPWISLGTSQISSAPAAVMAGDRLTVFARALNGTLTHKYYDTSKQKWTNWIRLGEGQISSAPSAVMAGDRLTVFARTLHGTLTHKYYDTSKQKWTNWIHLGDGQIS